MSPHVGFLRRIAWGSRNFFHQLNPYGVLQPEVTGTYLSGPGTLGWEPGVGLGLLALEIALPKFYPPHVDI